MGTGRTAPHAGPTSLFGAQASPPVHLPGQAPGRPRGDRLVTQLPLVDSAVAAHRDLVQQIGPVAATIQERAERHDPQRTADSVTPHGGTLLVELAGVTGITRRNHARTYLVLAQSTRRIKAFRRCDRGTIDDSFGDIGSEASRYSGTALPTKYEVGSELATIARGRPDRDVLRNPAQRVDHRAVNETREPAVVVHNRGPPFRGNRRQTAIVDDDLGAVGFRRRRSSPDR